MSASSTIGGSALAPGAALGDAAAPSHAAATSTASAITARPQPLTTPTIPDLANAIARS